MDTFTKKDLHQLIADQQEPCITIYLPTHKKGAEVMQAPIRLKNLLKEAQEKLLEKGLDEKQITSLLNKPKEYLDNVNTLNHLDNGLAFFITPQKFHYYRFPVSFEEKCYINNAFSLKPIVPLVTGDTDYYVLELDLNNIKFYHGYANGLKAVEIPNAPVSLEEAMKYDLPEKQLQYHTAAGAQKGGGPGADSAMFHGHGTGGNDNARKKEDIRRFFKMVDNALVSFLKTETAPLILAGVDYEVAIYREVSALVNLHDTAINQDVQFMNNSDLHKNSWLIASEYYDKERAEALAKYKELKGTGITSNSLEEIVKAIYAGRVQYLFVDVNAEVWGKFILDEFKVIIEEAQTDDNEDLLNHAVIQTILHDGKVYSSQKELMPDSTSIAAIYRY